MSKGQYGEDLEGDLRDLHQRLKQQQYRFQPLRRVHVPKGNGQVRQIVRLPVRARYPLGPGIVFKGR